MKLMKQLMSVTISTALCTPTFAYAQSGGDAKNQLKTDIVQAQKAQNFLNRFLQTFAVDVTREINMEAHGEIKGDLNGSLKGGQLGNVLALATGVLGLTAQLASTPQAILNTMMGLSGGGTGLGLMPITQALKGLQGFGFLSGNISGSLSGSYDAKGYQYNNEAVSFLMFAKDASISATLGSVSANRGYHTDQQTVNTLNAIQNNNYILSPELTTAFGQQMQILRDSLADAKDILAENIDSNEDIFKNAEARISSIEKWMNTKRVTIMTYSAGYRDEKLVCFDASRESRLVQIKDKLTDTLLQPAFDTVASSVAWSVFKKKNAEATEYTYVDHINGDFCTSIADSKDWTQEVRSRFTAYVRHNKGIFAGLSDDEADATDFATIKRHNRILFINNNEDMRAAIQPQSFNINTFHLGM